jgi:hypothetical protein
MTGFRASASTFLAASVSGALLIAPGCGTDAHGINDCRSIEEARCAAAANCRDSRGARVVSDVGSCQRFYRDQCLHGTTTESPGGPRVDECVGAIRDAGKCAAATVDTQDADCPTSLTPDTACAAILAPEHLSACDFLSPTPVEGGEGGTPSSTAGAGGQGNTGDGEATGGTAAGGVNGG